MNVLLLSALILLILFFIGWIASIKIKNASIVDAMWALSLGIPVFIFISSHAGILQRDFILLGMALIWSLRLGIHLAKRIYAHHPQEDPRYHAMRQLWKEQATRNFLGIFIINAALVFLLSLPFYVSSKYAAPLQTLEWIGLVVFSIGLIGESIADHQLVKFKKQAARGKICNIGLWNYSRHPNYFFESVIWVGIYLFCCAAPGGFYMIHAPAIMIFLLTKVTGIRPLERLLIKSKGEAYTEYQKTTSAFIPWFKSNPSKTL